MSARTVRPRLDASDGSFKEQKQRQDTNRHDRAGHGPQSLPLESAVDSESVHHNPSQLGAEKQTKTALRCDHQCLHGGPRPRRGDGVTENLTGDNEQHIRQAVKRLRHDDPPRGVGAT